ncbi:hypothetical protein [Streptomyces mirabilis]|uniref:hypothetical protein n=1 Tax=Streptomyces mirabilis TaxID=68239 RepID=UPI0036B4C37E
MNELCSNLRTFADHGNPGAPAIRRKQLASHLNQVIVTLEDALEQILVRGPEAHPKVISLLSKIADRISEGRWHRLLDDEDLSDRAHSNTTENLTAQEERKDLRIVLFGVGLATLVTVGGVLAGIPSPISLTVAGLAATIPAAIGGRKHLGVTPMSLLRNTSQSLTPNQSEGQESGES